MSDDALDLDAFDLDELIETVTDRIAPPETGPQRAARELREFVAAHEMERGHPFGEPRRVADDRVDGFPNIFQWDRAEIDANGGPEAVREIFERMLRRDRERRGMPSKPKALAEWERRQRGDDE